MSKKEFMKDLLGDHGYIPKYEEDQEDDNIPTDVYVEEVQALRKEEIQKTFPEFDVPIPVNKDGCDSYHVLFVPYMYNKEDTSLASLSHLVCVSPDFVYFTSIPVGIRPLTHSNMYELLEDEGSLMVQSLSTSERKIAPKAHLVAHAGGFKVFFTDDVDKKRIHIHTPLDSDTPVDVVLDDVPNIGVTYRKQKVK